MRPTPRLPKGFDNVYDPCEDSFFLLDCLEKDEQFIRSMANAAASPLVVAEIGTGTGIVSSFFAQLMEHKYIAMATDINPAACECASNTWDLNWPTGCESRPTEEQALPLEVVRGNLLDWMRPNQIDIIMFNPPYVPSETVPDRPDHDKQDSRDDDKWVDLALEGGENGMEITNIVLDQLDEKLSSNGVAYILFCASNHPKEVCKTMEMRGWSSSLVDTRRAGWEILSVYRFSRAVDSLQ